MEALVALGLASNVVQFIDFSTKLISKSRELGNDAASADHKDHAAIATHLKVLADKVSASAQSIAQASSTVPPEEKALLSVADGCCELSKKLLLRLENLGLLSAQHGSLRRRGKAAWKWVWNKKEIEETAAKLHRFGAQLAFHMTYQIRETQQEQRTWQSSKDDIQDVIHRINDVTHAVENLRNDVCEKLGRHHEEVLDSFTELRNQNSQLQVQMTQEISSTSLTLSSGIGNLEASVSAMMLKQSEEMKMYHSDIRQSLATVQVENSEFHGRTTQIMPQADNFNNTCFRDVLRSMLDEYQEKLLSEVRKEFRGTARSEMESLQNEALQALDRMQTDSQGYNSEAQTTPEYEIEPYHDDTRTGLVETNTMEEAQREPQKYGRQQKKDITMNFTKIWWIETRMGNFSLIIQDKVIFDPIKPPINVYELTAHFIPSPRWCAKGCSVAYRKTTDSRGSPQFGLQLETYRVLDDDHEVWEAIWDSNVDLIRSMLAQRVIFPSDRGMNGSTLLHRAVWYGRLDIIKTLVQSGADVNARDRLGLSPICVAILPSSFSQAQGYETFNYLRGLSNIKIGDLWLNYELADVVIDFASKIPEFCDIQNGIRKDMLNWMSVCRAVDFDFDIPGKRSFLETTIRHFGDVRYITKNKVFFYKCMDFAMVFDIILDQIVNTCPTIASEIPMYHATWRMTCEISDAWDSSRISTNSSTTLSVPYHGYYVDHTQAQTLTFLDHVMARAIAQRPDCIFDSGAAYGLDDYTVCRQFWGWGFWDIWEDILRSHGFDPAWVLEEDQRRWRARTAETSAHEVSVGIDAGQALEVKRRRGFVSTED